MGCIGRDVGEARKGWIDAINEYRDSGCVNDATNDNVVASYIHGKRESGAQGNDVVSLLLHPG